jgi:hypothetical protein
MVIADGYEAVVRWHVELNEKGKTLVVEHVDDVHVARDTASSLVRETHGGHKSIPEPQVAKAMVDVMDEDFADAEAGQEWTYEVADGYSVIVAALDDADTDDDCWKCRGVEEISA